MERHRPLDVVQESSAVRHCVGAGGLLVRAQTAFVARVETG